MRDPQTTHLLSCGEYSTEETIIPLICATLFNYSETQSATVYK